jgi:hypothetical protein
MALLLKLWDLRRGINTYINLDHVVRIQLSQRVGDKCVTSFIMSDSSIVDVADADPELDVLKQCELQAPLKLAPQTTSKEP